jgi:HEAT repeat protein
MSRSEHPAKQGKGARPRPREAAWRFLALLVLAMNLIVPATARSEEPEGDPVERLREALQTTYPDPAARDRGIKQGMAGLHSLSDLQRAVLLTEWREVSSGQTVDQASYARLLECFDASVRRILRGSDPKAVAAMIERLGEMAALARASGDAIAVVRPFGPDLADLVIGGPTSLRTAAARTLVQIEPPVFIAVPALGALLQDDDAELRRVAADSLAGLIQNALQAMNSGSAVGQRASRRGELALVASSVLPAVHHGLDDDRPEVRRRCLETIGLAAAALTRLLDAPSSRRTFQSEREELDPLLSALRDQGPILARLLGDNDTEARILTHRALEELGLAHGRWTQRRALRGALTEGGDEDWLGEVLTQTLPGLAAALQHPDVRVRRSALDALEMYGALALPVLPALTRALHDHDRFVRWAAVRTVGKLGPAAAPQTESDLTRLLRDPDGDLRKAAATALGRFHSASSAATTSDPH